MNHLSFVCVLKETRNLLMCLVSVHKFSDFFFLRRLINALSIVFLVKHLLSFPQAVVPFIVVVPLS